MRTHLLPYLLLFCFFGVGAIVFRPLVNRSGPNARRSYCQSNLKQIGLAFMQYTQDYDNRLPPRQWGKALLHYMKSEQVFQCAETTSAQGTSDYFFNSRFLGASIEKITSPNTLILMGDGQDDLPLDTTLSQLPSTWRTEQKSPSWRHLSTANYAFADGHVKALKVNRVNRDFRMVNR